jgi:hypothetical protein
MACWVHPAACGIRVEGGGWGADPTGVGHGPTTTAGAVEEEQRLQCQLESLFL